jgi:YXWGXW repeat-containing protein
MTRLRCVALLSVLILTVAVTSWATVFVSVAVGPPALPVYAQPLCPGPGYIWTPGYWAWGPAGYYWVPGTWVYPPQVGFLWTPGYWAFSAGLYSWHPGYWGPRVGFYGGINYGFGYTGSGYYGGYWHGRNFYYNRAVNNVNVANVHNVYNRTVINNVNMTRASYNGGPGGIQARPSSNQLAAERGRHYDATPAQIQHQQSARNQREQSASVNHGRPPMAATPRPGAFNAREAKRVNQPAVNSRPENTNAANRSVPRPPQSQQNHQQARVSENAARPPQNTHRQQRPAENVPRQPNYQQQARHINNQPRAASPQYHAASRPPSQRPAEAPRQAAAHRPQSSSAHRER